MQVFQLIERLMDLDPNAEVHFSYNYGDHWRTEVAPVVGEVREGPQLVVDVLAVRVARHGARRQHLQRAVEHPGRGRALGVARQVLLRHDEETGDYLESVRRVVVLG